MESPSARTELLKIENEGMSSGTASMSSRKMKVAVVGTQWGDEGKGKLVEALAGNSDFCARYNGGANAGHTIATEEGKYTVHILPSGIMHDKCTSVIGHGVVLNLQTLASEINSLNCPCLRHGRVQCPELECPNVLDERLVISSRASLLFQLHVEADVAMETGFSLSFSPSSNHPSALSTSESLGDSPVKSPVSGSPVPVESIGTTRRGIGPCYAGKCLRLNLRASDLLINWTEFEAKYMKLFEFYQHSFHLTMDPNVELEVLKKLRNRFGPRVDDLQLVFEKTSLNDLALRSAPQPVPYALDAKIELLVEGANATMLDLNCGTYPYVTSSETLSSGIGSGLGVSPRRLDICIGVMKAYTTRVGNGPFPTELHDHIGNHLQKEGLEFGATTKRPRRCGWLDLVIIKFSSLLNGVDALMMTKLDVLTGLKNLKICTSYILHDGRQVTHMPGDITLVKECVYHTLPGWSQSICGVTDVSGLPVEAVNYINFCQKNLSPIKIQYAGTGPNRSHFIKL